MKFDNLELLGFSAEIISRRVIQRCKSGVVVYKDLNEIGNIPNN